MIVLIQYIKVYIQTAKMSK